MSALDLGQDLVERLLGGGTADIRPRPGPQPLGNAAAELDAALIFGVSSGLGVGTLMLILIFPLHGWAL
jgi:hypothetical protein